MNKLKFTFLLAVSLLSVFAQAKDVDYSVLAPEDFMNMARYRMTLQNSFADLYGQVTHLRRNQGGAVYYPVHFTVKFGSMIQARITVNNHEVHQLQKDHRSAFKNVTSNVPANTPSILSSVGFKVEDLTMDFLDYKVTREYPAETVKTVQCRVLLLSNPANGEQVKVWISKEYLFPLKAEFFAKGSDLNGKPERTLEITGFEKVNDYYVATEISLFSSQYRTRIAFGNCKVYKADSPEAKAAFSK